MTPTEKQDLWNTILKLNNKPYIGSGYGAYNNVKNPALRGGLYTWKYRDMRDLYEQLVKYCELGESEAVWRVLLGYKTKIYPAYLRKIYQSLTCGAVPPAYTTVGTQVWSTKNLNVTTYRNGDPIPFATNQTEWDNYASSLTGAYRYYDDDPSTEAIYGKWYNSYAMQDSRNLAPVGYHIPTYYEWNVLNDYLVSQSQTMCGLKNVSLNVWDAPNSEAANLYDFEIVPGGAVPVGGASYYMGAYAYYWTYTLDLANPIYAYFNYLTTCSPGDFTATTLGNGMTVRIIDNISLVRGQLFGGGMLLENLSTEGITGYKEDGGELLAGYIDVWGCDGTGVNALDPQRGYDNTQAMYANGCNPLTDFIGSGANFINGYNDWYVPASDEVLIQIQQVPEYEALLDPNKDYWTSTEINDSQAYAITNISGTPGGGNWSLKIVSKNFTAPFLGMRRQTL
jgi:uncharacterized protein (TIGR02145 family)